MSDAGLFNEFRTAFSTLVRSDGLGIVDVRKVHATKLLSETTPSQVDTFMESQDIAAMFSHRLGWNARSNQIIFADAEIKSLIEALSQEKQEQIASCIRMAFKSSSHRPYLFTPSRGR